MNHITLISYMFHSARIWLWTFWQACPIVAVLAV